MLEREYCSTCSKLEMNRVVEALLPDEVIEACRLEMAAWHLRGVKGFLTSKNVTVHYGSRITESFCFRSGVVHRNSIADKIPTTTFRTMQHCTTKLLPLQSRRSISEPSAALHRFKTWSAASIHFLQIPCNSIWLLPGREMPTFVVNTLHYHGTQRATPSLGHDIYFLWEEAQSEGDRHPIRESFAVHDGFRWFRPIPMRGFVVDSKTRSRSGRAEVIDGYPSQDLVVSPRVGVSPVV